MTPFMLTVWILVGACALTWLLSLITREFSWVDRIWSVIPVAYVWVFALNGSGDARLWLMAILVTLWGARLTFNFARKGGYAPGGEDYRWAYVRAGMPKVAWEVFNLLFTVCFQNGLLWLISLPAYIAWQHRSPLTALDIVIAAVFLGCLAGEFVADQQQWRFQNWKKAERAAGREPSVRFLQTGLFRLSRHPNYFFEQAQWWLVFFFGCVSARSLWQWTAAGPVMLLAIFIGSWVLTERITLGRYPEYARYQKQVSAMIPWFRKRGDGEIITVAAAGKE